MVTAQAVDTSLSDADTTAAASFLQGRLAPAGLQGRYQADVDQRVGGRVAAAARRPAPIRRSAAGLQTLSTDLPLYAGIVQEADFNERQASYPLAAAYLAEANNLMRSSILPAAGAGLRTRGRRWPATRRTRRRPVLAGPGRHWPSSRCCWRLVWRSGGSAGYFRRTWNVALAVATVVVVVLGVWGAVALATQDAGVAVRWTNGSQSRLDVHRRPDPGTASSGGRRAHPADAGLGPELPGRLPSTAATCARCSPADRGSLPTGSRGPSASSWSHGPSPTWRPTERCTDRSAAPTRSGDLSAAVALASGSGARISCPLCRPGSTKLWPAASGIAGDVRPVHVGRRSDLDGLVWGLAVGPFSSPCWC